MARVRPFQLGLPCPFIARHVGGLHLMSRPECLAVGQAVVQEASSPRQARWQSSLRNGISRRNGNHQEVPGPGSTTTGYTV
jgi:hypothetical protein